LAVADDLVGKSEVEVCEAIGDRPPVGSPQSTANAAQLAPATAPGA
jgi:hypothetical protein